jgi:prepilin-type N-terminal cleavage/methylation domain-containing protein
MKSCVPRCVCMLVGLVLLAAAGLKMASPLQSLTAVLHAADPVVSLSLPGAAVLAVLLIGVETALGALLITGPTGPARTCTAALLTLFAIILVLRFTQPGAPSCGCLGQALAESAPSQAWWDAARNLAFAAALLLIGAPRPRPTGSAGAAHPVAPRGARAFTILELLVSVVIIGVLLALMFPALVAVRRQAQIIRSHAHLRQVFVATHAYTEANRDTFPRFEALGGSWDYIRHRSLVIQSSYFSAHQVLWMALVAPDDPAFHAMAARLSYAERTSPEYEDDEPLSFYRFYTSTFWMSPTLVADPSVFDEPISRWTSIDSPALLRGVRSFEITHPSRKGLFVDLPLMFSLLDPSRSESPPPIIAVFADGSAATYAYDKEFENKNVVHVRGGQIPYLPVLSTRHGVRGVDR